MIVVVRSVFDSMECTADVSADVTECQPIRKKQREIHSDRDGVSSLESRARVLERVCACVSDSDCIYASVCVCVCVCVCARAARGGCVLRVGGWVGGWGWCVFTCACQEMESSILHAMGCGEFFAMMEEPKLHERLKGVTVRFVTRYTEDKVETLEMGKGSSRAMAIVFKAMACLLVLLEPTPGYLGTSTSQVAKVMSYEGNGTDDDFLSSLRLVLQENGLWQSRVDEVLKLGGSAIKYGEQLKEHVAKMKSILDEDGFSEHFVQAVNIVDTLKNGLRKNAVDELLSLIREMTQKYIEKLCASPAVSESDGGMIQVLMTAVDKFPQKDMLQLKQKFLKWQKSVQVELHKQQAAALGNKILNQAGNEEEEVPVEELAQLLDKFKAEKEL